jgi:hypothetical protein
MDHGKLGVCEACGGFVPRGATSCPLCASAIPRWVMKAALAVGGAGLAVTLSACYGQAPRHYYAEPLEAPPSTASATPTCHDPALDTDRDGHCGEHDCAEDHPGIQSDCPTE